MKKWIPDRKILNGGIVAVVGWFILTGLREFTSVDVDTEVQAFVTGVVTWAYMYVLPPRASDTLNRVTKPLFRTLEEQFKRK